MNSYHTKQLVFDERQNDGNGSNSSLKDFHLLFRCCFAIERFFNRKKYEVCVCVCVFVSLLSHNSGPPLLMDQLEKSFDEYSLYRRFSVSFLFWPLPLSFAMIVIVEREWMAYLMHNANREWTEEKKEKKKKQQMPEALKIFRCL